MHFHDPDSGFGYPRPQLERREWFSLNGEWEFALDPDAIWAVPEEVSWQSRIRVPFAPETTASGIGHAGFYRAVWYRRELRFPERPPGYGVWLHFGAVDYYASVWVNGNLAGTHEGGYNPFSLEITGLLNAAGRQTIVVRAEDDPSDLAKPRGKQDWQLEPHSIWYPRTTGIWQTVWAEAVPRTYIGGVRWTPSVDRWEIGLDAHIAGERRDGLRLRVRLAAAGKPLADDSYGWTGTEVFRRIALSDPGIDDYRNELLWSPKTPTLIDAELTLLDENGAAIDSVHSYTALRAIGVQGDKFVLNGRPLQLRMVLDQGYWRDTGITAPDDAALRRDIELAMAMGFNGVRKHQKIEDPRYLYWADRLGLLVWEEMPSPYRFTKQAVERLTTQWIRAIERDFSHPCIVAWVPFNESWGVPDLPDSPAQRHWVQSIYHLTKTLDPTRPVIGNDGWESVATDIIGIHDYDDQAERMARRYGTDESLPRLFKRERPGGRLLWLADTSMPTDQPIMITEFGGIAYSGETGSWGYTRSESAEDFAERYTALLRVVRSLPVLAGFCYTQFADTYQEANGLLYMDRRPKIPIEQIAFATRGPRTLKDRQIEAEWRERLMNTQRAHYLVPAEDYQTQESR